ncbi:MAG: hypothetical protein ACXVW8_15830, partial [Nocardioidaceae bacterium]
MTPLQKVAMGLVIVVLDPLFFGGWDGLPDPLGWALVIAGLLALRPAVRNTDTLLWTAVLAGAVSVATYPPQVTAALAPSVGWLVSLPQVAFCLMLSGALAPYAGDLERRLSLMRWVFLAVALFPVLVLGGGVERLLVPTAALAVLSTLYLVYLLFRLAGRPFAR